MNIPLVILCLAFASCSPRKQDNNAQASTKYPNVPTMGAAHDAGQVKP